MYVFCFSKYVIDETGGSYMDAVVEILKGLITVHYMCR